MVCPSGAEAALGQEEKLHSSGRKNGVMVEVWAEDRNKSRKEESGNGYGPRNLRTSANSGSAERCIICIYQTYGCLLFIILRRTVNYYFQ